MMGKVEVRGQGLISTDLPGYDETRMRHATLIGAMGLVSFALTVGLYSEAGFGVLLAVISGLSAFILLISLHGLAKLYNLTLQLEPRIETVEGDVGRLTRDMARMDQLALKYSRFEELAGQLADVQVSLLDGGHGFGIAQGDAVIEQVRADIAALGKEVKTLKAEKGLAVRRQKDQQRTELQLLQTLVKQLAVRLANEDGDPNILALPREVSLPQRKEPERQEGGGARAMQAGGGSTAASMAIGVGNNPPAKRSVPADADPAGPVEEVSAPVGREPSFADDGQDGQEAQMLDVLRQSIETNRVDLYLQPIVSLPDRDVRYYEALTRIRGRTGELFHPPDYLHIAEQAGIMPFIDNVMLFRTVQVIRRLAERESPRGVFCNISAFSLLDPEFFPEFIEFMEQNQELSRHLVFEFSQPMIKNATARELQGLTELSGLGFQFSLDQVTELDIDYLGLHDQAFRFIKIDANIFLHGMEQAGARIHAADMRSYLERFSFELIVEKVEDENTLPVLLDYGVELGQGYLFSEPRPVRPEIFGKAALTEAA